MEILAGRVLKFYRSISVASVDVTNHLKLNDLIHIQGHTTDFDQTIESMQMKHKDISEAKSGDLVGIKVNDYVRKHDLIYRVED